MNLCQRRQLEQASAPRSLETTRCDPFAFYVTLYGKVELLTIFDTERDHYQLVHAGWQWQVFYADKMVHKTPRGGICEKKSGQNTVEEFYATRGLHKHAVWGIMRWLVDGLLDNHSTRGAGPL